MRMCNQGSEPSAQRGPPKNRLPVSSKPLTQATWVLPTEGGCMKTEFKYNRLDKNDVAVLLVDHQSGLVNLVQDFSPDDFKNNVLALADAARYFKLPTIL